MHVSVLSGMWNLDERLTDDIADMSGGMSLASVSSQESANDDSMKTGIILPDLHLKYCRHQAKSEILESKWHEALLHGYLESTSAALCRDPSEPRRGCTPIMVDGPRPRRRLHLGMRIN